MLIRLIDNQRFITFWTLGPHLNNILCNMISGKRQISVHELCFTSIEPLDPFDINDNNLL